MSEIFEGLYLTDRAEKIARDFQNDSIETTKDKYLLTFHPLMSGGLKVHRRFSKNLLVIFAGLLSAYDLLLPPVINQLTWLTVCKVYKVNNVWKN